MYVHSKKKKEDNKMNHSPLAVRSVHCSVYHFECHFVSLLQNIKIYIYILHYSFLKLYHLNFILRLTGLALVGHLVCLISVNNI